MIPNLLEWGEIRDTEALIAPRLLLIISDAQDHICPIKATRRVYAELEPVYNRLSASSNLDKDFFDGVYA